jgi:hypothetical protein
MRLSATLLRDIMVKAHKDMLAGTGDAKLVRECIKDYIRAQKEVAPYEDAKLVSVKVAGDADNPLRSIIEMDLSNLTDDQLTALEPVLALLAGSNITGASPGAGDPRATRSAPMRRVAACVGGAC